MHLASSILASAGTAAPALTSLIGPVSHTVLNELAVAVLSNNEASVETALNDGGPTSVNKHDEKGRTALHYAAFGGNVKILDTLIDNGASVDAIDVDGYTPLHIAVVRNQAKAVQILIDEGSSLWLPCHSKWQTPLHCAVSNCSLECVKTILHHNCDGIDKTDGRGSTALHIASYHGFTDIIQTLLSFGSDITMRDIQGRTALHWAALGGCDDALKLLLSKGADAKAVDSKKRTALHMGAQVGSCIVIEVILQYTDLPIDCLDESNCTPLHYAVQNSHMKATKMLLENGASSQAQSRDGSTPLHFAAYYAENNHVLNVLLDREKDLATAVAVTMFDGSTLLHKACEWGRVSRVEKLLRNGANVDAKTINKATPLHFAAIAGQQLPMKLLFAAGASKNERVKNGGYTALHMACHKGYLEAVRGLIEAGCDPHILDDECRTPLHLLAASDAPHADLCLEPLLLSRLCDLSARDIAGTTALHTAARTGKGELVKRLLRAGAFPMWTDKMGRTPLHLASLHAHNSKAIQALVENNGKCVTKQDKSGFYPVHYAAFRGNHNLCDYYISLMPPSEVPSSGPPLYIHPLHIAAAMDFPSVLKFLMVALKKKADELDKKFNSQLKLWETVGTDTDRFRRIPLHYAMYYGHFDCCKVLLINSASPKQALMWEDCNGHTPMHLAACKGHLEVIAWATDKFDITLKKLDRQKRTCLLLASLSADHLDTEQMSSLLAKCSLDGYDENGRGLLHRACAAGNVELVRELLHLGCRANLTDCYGVTPMHVACRVGSRDIVRLLLDSSVSVDTPDDRDLMPADWAASAGKIEILDDLLNSSGDTSACSTDSAFGTGDDRSTPERHPVDVKDTGASHSLSDESETATITSEDGRTAGEKDSEEPVDRDTKKQEESVKSEEEAEKQDAVKEGESFASDENAKKSEKVEEEESEREEGTQVMETDKEEKGGEKAEKPTADGESLGSEEMTEKPETVEEGDSTDCEEKQNNGDSVENEENDEKRHCTESEKEQESMGSGDGEMLNDSADTGSAEKQTEREIVEDEENSEKEQESMDSGDKQKEQDSMASEESMDQDKTVVEQMDNKYFKGLPRDDIITDQAVLLAASNGHLECLKRIGETFPSLLTVCDQLGRSSLHLASKSGHTECVRYLLDVIHLQIDAVDKDGKTSLMYSVQHPDSTQATEYLLSHGSDISLRDSDGNTVFHLCAIFDNTPAGILMVRELSHLDEQPIADVANGKNGQGQTAVHIACKKGMFTYLSELLPYAGQSLWEKDDNFRMPLTCTVESVDVADCMELVFTCMVDVKDKTPRSSLSSSRSRNSNQRKVSSVSSEDGGGTF